jgi:hypothetical protein
MKVDILVEGPLEMFTKLIFVAGSWPIKGLPADEKSVSEIKEKLTY